MKTELENQALYHTQDIMEKWYIQELEPVKKALDKSSSWIGGADGQFYVGKDAVLKGLELASSHMYACTLSSEMFQIVDSGPDWCVVAGTFMFNLENNRMSMHEPQRLTFVWRQKNNQLVISHIHVSNPMVTNAPDEDFPVKAAKASYDYIQEKFNQGSITVMDSERQLHHFDKEMVCYLSADDKYVEIHTKDRTIRVHRNLSDIQKELFSEFLIIHRSFCVNKSCLKTLRQYEVELDDGTILPVSKKRYPELCRQLGVNI